MTSESQTPEILKMLIFTFSPKIIRKCNFDGLLIMKRNDLLEHTQEVSSAYSTNIFGLRAKTDITPGISPDGNHPTPNFNSLPYPYLMVMRGKSAKMIAR